MPKTHSKRRRPVTAQHSPASTPLPPIHISGHEKIIIDTTQLTVSRGKLGKSSTETRRRINHFHTLIKQYAKLGALKQQTSDPQAISEVDEQIQAVSEEMTQMGGLDWYQRASLLGQSKQRGGDTSRWFVPKLRELDLHKGQKLRLLDVGALSCLNYAKERAWIDVTPIDLNSQEPGIYQQDFLDIKPPYVTPPNSKVEDNKDTEDSSTSNSHLFRVPFDVVCLSLVVNFIGDPVKRGDMLRQAAQLLVPNGYLFLVLPLSCVTNSRYLNDDHFLAIMTHLGFTQLFSHHTAKLAYYVYKLTSQRKIAEKDHKFSKRLIHPGAGRNNFSIVV
ncbi:25S rRNA (adenine2142-N1)-methyltransferase [Coemansia sp. RSA 521]|nr:25S rRNA (adenine2142-N1)-methyltransferase [Coemansia sp. RSA 521]